MRFKLGIAVGFAAGYWVATTSADERREKLDELLAGVRENPRVSRVTETVSRDARRLGDAVEQRFTKVADGTVGAVAGTVEPSGSSTSPSGSTSSGSAKSSAGSSSSRSQSKSA